jgi:hypothetical protein
VLQVGNLQLTRSMYRQLDEAAPERFEPFGRVKDNKRRPKDGWRLVGRDGETGVLLVGRDAKPVRSSAISHNRRTGRSRRA